MLNNVCTHCQQRYHLKDVRVDLHWNSYSLEPVYCHCPHCDSVLEGVYPDSVDLAKHLKLPYMLIFICYFVAFCLGIVTGTLDYIAPLIFLLFGAWLAKSARLKDLRIIGWILIGISVTAFTLLHINLFPFLQ